MSRLNAVAAASAAMQLHDDRMGLEPHKTSATQVWHMLFSLMEFCDFYSLDFDSIVKEARSDRDEIGRAG